MEDDHLRNPAGRLYRFIEGMQQRVGPQAPIMNALTEYLDYPGGTFSRQLLIAVADIWDLPDQVDRAAAALVNPAVPVSTFAGDLDRARGAVSLLQDLRTPGSTFLSQSDGSVLRSLEVLSHLLNSSAGMTVPTQDAIDAVHDAAQELLVVVREDDSLDEKLKRVIFEHAFAIVGAVGRFKLTGVEGILAEYDRLAGHLAHNPEETNEIRKHLDVAKAVVKVGAALALVASLMGSVVSIEGSIQTLLGIDAAASPAPTPGPDAPPAP